eukprot:TRINITY_DN490_c0_g2_i1.p1 TRINITY_DN490_c0_g2~~TRINITY_DN490_c0_g2_i1.p1  ORF type:complete len:113 (+),score=28.30 TRINITY_DN490_c0_g2_i1:115-453(+)
MVKVRVLNGPKEGLYEADCVDYLKQQILEKQGVPTEYQSLVYQGQEMGDDHFKGNEEVEVELRFRDLSGGASVGIRTGRFELKCRTCCFVSEIDGEWEKCQYCCIHCSCNIS